MKQKKSESIVVPESLKGYEDAIVNIVDMVYDSNTMAPEDLNISKPKLELDKNKLNKKKNSKNCGNVLTQKQLM